MYSLSVWVNDFERVREGLKIYKHIIKCNL